VTLHARPGAHSLVLDVNVVRARNGQQAVGRMLQSSSARAVLLGEDEPLLRTQCPRRPRLLARFQERSKCGGRAKQLVSCCHLKEDVQLLATVGDKLWAAGHNLGGEILIRQRGYDHAYTARP